MLFFLGSQRNAETIHTYQRFLEPVETQHVVSGEILNTEKISRWVVLFEIMHHNIEYAYTQNGKTQTKTMKCDNMAACYFIKKGTADILIDKTGEYAVPLDLRRGLKTYVSRAQTRVQRGRVMSVIFFLIFGYYATMTYLQDWMKDMIPGRI